jgi:AraC-like DNA-binding protein
MGMVTGLVTYAHAHGVEPEALWAASGSAPLDPEPDARAPLQTYVSLHTAASALTGDDAFALHYGADVSMAEVSIVGLIMEAAPDMAQALRQLQRYGRLAADISGMDGPQLTLAPRPHGLFLIADGIAPYRELVEESFARLVRGPARFLERPHVLSAHFAYPAPGHAAEYELVLGCPVIFDADETALELHPEVGSWPVAQHPRYVFGILADAADQQLQRHSAGQTWTARAAEHVRSTVHEGGATADRTARALHCSRSTLARRLAEEGTSHSAVLDDVRRDLAIRYLSAGKVSVSQVAYLVGFADAPSFIRAFRRWTGRNPGSYRV